jgi:hypothetical protein
MMTTTTAVDWIAPFYGTHQTRATRCVHLVTSVGMLSSLLVLLSHVPLCSLAVPLWWTTSTTSLFWSVTAATLLAYTLSFIYIAALSFYAGVVATLLLAATCGALNSAWLASALPAAVPLPLVLLALLLVCGAVELASHSVLDSDAAQGTWINTDSGNKCIASLRVVLLGPCMFTLFALLDVQQRWRASSSEPPPPLLAQLDAAVAERRRTKLLVLRRNKKKTKTVEEETKQTNTSSTAAAVVILARRLLMLLLVLAYMYPGLRFLVLQHIPLRVHAYYPDMMLLLQAYTELDTFHVQTLAYTGFCALHLFCTERRAFALRFVACTVAVSWLVEQVALTPALAHGWLVGDYAFSDTEMAQAVLGQLGAVPVMTLLMWFTMCYIHWCCIRSDAAQHAAWHKVLRVLPGMLLWSGCGDPVHSSTGHKLWDYVAAHGGGGSNSLVGYTNAPDWTFISPGNVLGLGVPANNLFGWAVNSCTIFSLLFAVTSTEGGGGGNTPSSHDILFRSVPLFTQLAGSAFYACYSLHPTPVRLCAFSYSCWLVMRLQCDLEGQQRKLVTTTRRR